MSAPRSRAIGLSVAAVMGFTAGFAACGTAVAQKKYDTGASDTEIKIGNIIPYTGPASVYSSIGKIEAAYFQMVNDNGGINGRKINFISYDDSYSPPKAIEQVQKLVEDDGVLAVFSPLGTPSNTAIQKYLNFKRVPQLFIATGATKWNDPKNFPWTMGWQPSYQSEAKIYAKYILKEKPQARIAVLYQNDDLGKDYLKGFKDQLGAESSRIVIEESYETSEPTIDTHIFKIKALDPDVLVSFVTPKFAVQTIKKLSEIGWQPAQILANVAVTAVTVLKPTNSELAKGVLSASYAKEGADPQWKNDPGMKRWEAVVDKYMPGAEKGDGGLVYGYAIAQTLHKVLEMCGDDLTRENVMKQAASLKDFVPDTLIPGVKINTTENDFSPIQQLQMMRYGGDKWHFFGEVYSANAQTN